jgi:predicted ABC-type ATPase
VESHPSDKLDKSLFRRGVGELKDKARTPKLYVIAGPNGAGKTTFARKFLPESAICMEFVNADLIAGGLSPLAPENAAIHAGRIMLERIHSLGQRGADFGIETTLSGKTYIRRFHDLKKRGYQIHLFFLWLSSIKLALERIEIRVKHGGQDIPEAIVRRPVEKSLSNFFKFYKPLADSWTVFDNSGQVPKVVAFEEFGKSEIVDSDTFSLILKQKDKR